MSAIYNVAYYSRVQHTTIQLRGMTEMEIKCMNICHIKRSMHSQVNRKSKQKPHPLWKPNSLLRLHMCLDHLLCSKWTHLLLLETWCSWVLSIVFGVASKISLLYFKHTLHNVLYSAYIFLHLGLKCVTLWLQLMVSFLQSTPVKLVRSSQSDTTGNAEDSVPFTTTHCVRWVRWVR